MNVSYWKPLIIPSGPSRLNPRNSLQLIISALVFVEKSHRELIKMLRVLDKSEKLKVDKNMVQDCSCMQDNLLIGIPIKISPELHGITCLQTSHFLLPFRQVSSYFGIAYHPSSIVN